MNKDKKLWGKILGLKGLASVGITDIIGSGMGAIFWFYIASVIEAEQYGEISYFLGIAGLIQIIALVGTTNVITVCLAKKIRIEATLYFLSLVISFISSVIIFVLLHRIDVSLLIFAFGNKRFIHSNNFRYKVLYILSQICSYTKSVTSSNWNNIISFYRY